VATVREQFAQKGFTDQEAEAIFLRAAELQRQAEQLHTRLPRVMLDESAAAVGIPREFVEQAIQQLQAELRAQAARWTARRRTASAVAIGVAVFLALAASVSHRAFNARLAEVEATQAQLDNVLQRRHDLIPNLMAVANASTAQEQDLIASLGMLYQEIPRGEAGPDILILHTWRRCAASRERPAPSLLPAWPAPGRDAEEPLRTRDMHMERKLAAILSAFLSTMRCMRLCPDSHKPP
jgi:hypothetical protein